MQKQLVALERPLTIMVLHRKKYFPDTIFFDVTFFFELQLIFRLTLSHTSTIFQALFGIIFIIHRLSLNCLFEQWCIIPCTG